MSNRIKTPLSVFPFAIAGLVNVREVKDLNFSHFADLNCAILLEDWAILLQVRHECADVAMVALGPRMLARLNLKGKLHTLQQPLKAPILLAGFVQPKLSQARMGSASGDSGDPPPALVLCGPSGAGKSTLMKLLTSEFRYQEMLCTLVFFDMLMKH